MSESVRWVLLVEDDRNLRNSLKWLLEDAGFVVVAVGDAADAVRALGQRPFDAAVVDLNLAQKLDGIPVLERVRERSPHARRVLMSGDVPPGVERSISAGLVEKFLLKPVSSATLIAAIDGPSTPARVVMLVEDDHDASAAVEQLLRDEGFGVMTAANGLDALDALRAGPRPDAILLDLAMPVMDGFTFCEVRRSDPALAEIPVIVVTGVSDRIEPGRLGARAVIPKPIDLLRFGRILELLEA